MHVLVAPDKFRGTLTARQAAEAIETGWRRARPDDLAELVPMADVPATVATFTIDRLAYSLAPPTIAVVIDFDGGGRFSCQLTDAAEVRIGDRVQMTFRRIMTAQGIHNYFWKAKPIRD